MIFYAQLNSDIKYQPIRCRQRTYIYIMIIFFSIFAVSCTKKEAPMQIEINDTPLFAGYPNYMVVTESYLRIYREKNTTGNVIDIARKGDILVLIKSEGESDLGYAWYAIKNSEKTGWVLIHSPILVYSREQAEFLSQQLSKN